MSELQLREVTLHYEQFGQGHDVVWVAGGGSLGSDWHKYQIPFFEPHFRNTTFDNRGIGQTSCDEPMPWPLEKFSQDTIALIEQVCEPPVVAGGDLVRQCHRPAGGDRPTRPRAVGHRHGHRVAQHRLGVGLPGGRDRAAQGAVVARRDVRRHALRRDALPGEGARRPRALAEAAR